MTEAKKDNEEFDSAGCFIICMIIFIVGYVLTAVFFPDQVGSEYDPYDIPMYDHMRGD